MEGLWSGPPILDGNVADEHWIEVESGVSIRVLVWNSEGTGLDSGTVVMVPGWGSLFEGWRPLVTEWVKSRHLIYIETREKASSKFNRRISKDDFSIERHSKDIAAVLEALDVKQANIDWYSSSLGSTILLSLIHI